MSKDVSVISFNLTIVEEQEKYFQFLSNQVKNYLETFSLFFCNFNMYEHILLEIYDRNTMRRNMIYFFYWGTQYPKKFFLRNLHESMKAIVIWNSKNGTYRILSNKATAYKKHHLDMVNWWKDGFGLFHHPTFPLTTGKIYTDFKKKIFKVPVIHKPPWFFVRYTNTTLKVVGGRDDRILSLLASKLNFWYRYIDPPERTQGNAIAKNGSFQGVLGMIWRREADLFIGDVALTEERSNFVEFSFITQADSGAFVTHAPRRLNEAVALLRPFQWEVWPAIIITFIVVGPVLYAIIALPNIWQPRFKVRSQVRLFFDATWFTITILMKQTGKEPSSSQKARFFIILLSISATYIINDMYSANLTSLLARPGKEKTINDLHQLVDAMENRNYKLYVERSSCGLLENGTGIYGKIWRLMKSRQPKNFLVETVEDGVKLVRDTRNVALIAGRETLIFDIQRFDSSNFHLSEKLNTAYSAIAFQLGCPYIEEINKILMAIFEAGIITKMTQNEYEKLRKQKQLLSSEPEKLTIQRNQKEIKSPLKGNKTNNKLQPVTLKMVQGAFYILAIGYIISGFILLGERIFYNNQHKKLLGPSSRSSNKLGSSIMSKLSIIIDCVKKCYRRIMHEAFVATLEYLE
ncbi:ionotropic receptor 40a isoform X2 [Coccinella septempunctata]|uniref:ionotropic receptor 40a isoform X2 n=1 Tax=Coccinella septempunctata TaxID=41139 RepID=UPI001D05F9CD|nr:ionotropic receptor 40a isoform X2 [Coccinella septempunctata]